MEQGTTPATTYLPDELVVEILARLPAKSLCRFKCVSQRWRRLISDPAHRALFAQTLSGFFFVSDDSPSRSWRFTALPSCVTPLEQDGGSPTLVDAALSFVPSSCGEMKMLDSCNGLLLLLHCSSKQPSSRPRAALFYVVCNPATREWVALPQPRFTGDEPCFCTHAALGFDPAISSHFYVFQVVEVHDDRIRCPMETMEIYSSETGTWVLKIREPDVWIHFYGRTTYFNGSMHLPTDNEQVVSVEPNGGGQPWMKVTRVRHGREEGRGYVGHSQGRLVYANNDRKDDVLSVYVRDEEEWITKHSVSKPHLLFEPWKKKPMLKPTYYIAGFHPDCDLVFFYDRTRKMLISYDMNHGDRRVVCTLQGFSRHAHHPFVPYVPWYSRGLLASPINSK